MAITLLDEYKTGGTITTGVRLYHIPCNEWFEEWSSRVPYPSVEEIVRTCRQHVCVPKVSA